MITDNDIKTLHDKVDEIKTIIDVGESPFQALSYLKIFVQVLMNKVVSNLFKTGK